MDAPGGAPETGFGRAARITARTTTKSTPTPAMTSLRVLLRVMLTKNLVEGVSESSSKNWIGARAATPDTSLSTQTAKIQPQGKQLRKLSPHRERGCPISRP